MVRPTQSTSSRGYGTTHQAERSKWEPLVAAGNIMCARQGPKCIGKPIQPGQAWDLGHNDDRSGYNGPECVPCNRGAGGANGAAVTNEKKLTISRDW